MADKFGRFLHDRRQIFVGRFYWQTKLANFIVRLTSALVILLLATSECQSVDSDDTQIIAKTYVSHVPTDCAAVP